MSSVLAFTSRGEVAKFLSPEPSAAPAGGGTLGYARPEPSPRLAPISATVLTHNSEPLLGEVLASLNWCNQVVVLDTGSTDGTLALAASFANVSLHQLKGPFPGFGRAHRQAVTLARNDWILSIDSDEIVSPLLADEIKALPLDARTVYSIPFQNVYNGKHITTCGWSPDRHERLFNRTATNFCTSEVHERVNVAGLSVVSVRYPITHYSYRSTDDFLRKMATYARLFADQNVGKKTATPVKAVTRSAWAFFKSYVLEGGLRQGTEGLTISAYKSQVVFWKYLMLHEANRRPAT